MENRNALTKMRLQKLISMSGAASRRKAEELIKEGRVTVNGKIVQTSGTLAGLEDDITVDGKKINPSQTKVYIMLNKPAGYITTVKDQFERPTVMDLVKDGNAGLHPVGRLDYDTSGLLLLTNDGEFTNLITHPRKEIKKNYLAMVKGIPDEGDSDRLMNGIKVEGYKTAPAAIRVIETKGSGASAVSYIEITIHEGKNREIRKIFETLGHSVLKLKRTGVGELSLGVLPEGSWRYLSRKEISSFIN